MYSIILQYRAVFFQFRRRSPPASPRSSPASSSQLVVSLAFCLSSLSSRPSSIHRLIVSIAVVVVVLTVLSSASLLSLLPLPTPLVHARDSHPSHIYAAVHPPASIIIEKVYGTVYPGTTFYDARERWYKQASQEERDEASEEDEVWAVFAKRHPVRKPKELEVK